MGTCWQVTTLHNCKTSCSCSTSYEQRFLSQEAIDSSCSYSQGAGVLLALIHAGIATVKS